MEEAILFEIKIDPISIEEIVRCLLSPGASPPWKETEIREKVLQVVKEGKIIDKDGFYYLS